MSDPSPSTTPPGLMNALVFLVDDDDDDRLLIREAFEAAAPGAMFVEAGNGVELLSMLTPEGNIIEPLALLPDLIVLDMNMPKMNGLEALKRMRAIPALQGLATVMLSTSSDPHLMEAARANGAQAYLIKPDSFDQYEALARSLAERYLGAAS